MEHLIGNVAAEIIKDFLIFCAATLATWGGNKFRKTFLSEQRIRTILCEETEKSNQKLFTDDNSPLRKIIHEENERSNDHLVENRLNSRYLKTLDFHTTVKDVVLKEVQTSVAELRRDIDHMPERMARHTANTLAAPLSELLENMQVLIKKQDESQ